GTVTPTVTISRIGTLYTTAAPSAKPTTVITQEPAVTTIVPAATTKPVAKKTTYAPVSPVTVLGALAGAAGIAALIRKTRK
ncbi:MAG: hypothetical protein LUQ19_01875, partial [Methanoregula sp.]|nr:hypothetical protein [Methanoregula sp.]